MARLGIARHVDSDQYNKTIEIEEQERETVAAIADALGGGKMLVRTEIRISFSGAVILAGRCKIEKE
jgi:hypothetical protein